MITFKLRYYTELYNKRNPLEINEGTIVYPLFVKWSYEGIDYEFVRNDKDFISFIFVSQEFILVNYYKDSVAFPAPYNLVLYNLKKQMLKTIPPPKPINVKGDLVFSGIGEEKILINGVEYLKIALGYDSVLEHIREFRYLNLETFEFHPTENTFLKWNDQR